MPGSKDTLRIGDWTVEPELDRITCASVITSLRPQVMEVLLFLARHKGRVIGTEELMNRLWANKVVTDSTVYNTLAELRNALAAADDTRTYVETIPKKGYRLVAEVEILDADSTSAEAATVASPRGSAQRFVRRRPVVSGLVVLGLLLVVIATTKRIGVSFWEQEIHSQANPVRRFTIELPQNLLDFRTVYNPVIISNDGRRIVFSGAPELASPIYSRAIDDFQVVAIDGTETSAGVMALSPDGDWIAFVDLTDGLLKKVRISGGIPTTLCDPGGKTWSITWGPDGYVVYESSAYAGLMQVSASGGLPRQLTAPAHGVFHKQPSFLADGSALLFTVGERGSTTRKSDRISVLSLKSGETKKLVAGSSPAAIRDDFLIYYRDRALWIAGFDSESLAVTSESMTIVKNVHYEDFAHYSLSRDGTLVYVVDANLKRRHLVWVDRNGVETTIPIEPTAFVMPRISPDGERVAVVIEDNASADLWLYSVRRGTMTRLTNDESREASPVWSRDGSFIVYSSNRVDDLFRITTDGTNSVEQLTDSEKYQFAHSIMPGDRQVLFAEGDSNTLPSDIALLTLGSGKQPEVLLASKFSEFDPAISPDGHWLAYVSNRSGAEEVYVRPFPNLSASEVQISIGGGSQPRWTPDGRELIYRGPSDLTVVEITAEPDLRPGRPEPLLSLGDYLNYDMGNFDIAPNGQQFLMVKPATYGDFPVNRVVIVQNWLDDIAGQVVSH